MREIKFRAWDNKNKVMWDEGVYISLDGELSFDKSKMITGYNPFEFVLMQSTGLKDKNGKEIYEGDICRIGVKGLPGEFITDMRFFDKYSMFAFATVPHYYVTKPENKPMGSSGSSTSWKPFLPSSYKSVEVIGNIYENPELLKG